jgi:hypothetical protein
MSLPDAGQTKPPTLIVVLKPRAGTPAEAVHLPGFELRHDPDRRRVVLHRQGSDIACIDSDELESWSVETD